MLKNFRAYHAALHFYRLCEDVRCPRHLREQLSRASSSIALNLSEGSARPTRRDRKRFYSMAMSSLRECQTILELARIPLNSEVRQAADSLGAQVYRLLKALLPTPDELAISEEAKR
jgi:four helix bundle protein